MKIIFISLLLVSLSILTGCSKERSDLDTFFQQESSKPAPKIDPIPEVKTYTPYTYQADDRRSPFQPMAISSSEKSGKAGQNVRPDMQRSLEKLEEFSLDSLKMVGTLSINNQRYALIKAPDSVVYRITTGNHAGHHFGKVTAVGHTSVHLTEIIEDGRGGYIEQPAQLHLAN